MSPSACTISAQTGSVCMHRHAVYVPKAKPSTPGRLDTCEGLPGGASIHLLRPRHQLRLSLQKDININRRSRSCSRYSQIVSSALGQTRSIQNGKRCDTALAMPCRSSLWATTILASHGRPGAYEPSKSTPAVDQAWSTSLKSCVSQVYVHL